MQSAMVLAELANRRRHQLAALPSVASRCAGTTYKPRGRPGYRAGVKPELAMTLDAALEANFLAALGKYHAARLATRHVQTNAFRLTL